MEFDQFQSRIDSGSCAADFLAIGKAYLQGDWIRDPVAAQAWLMKAIEADDPVCSPAAMGILARELLGTDRVIPESEIPELRKRAAEAAGREKQELDAILALI